MSLFTGSSEHAASAAVAPPSADVQEKLDLLAIDEPLPEPPARDIARLLVQSPYRIYFYWNFKNDPFTIAHRAFTGRNQDFRLMVRLQDATGGETFADEVAGFTRSYWFNALPAHTYRAEVGLFSEARPFFRLLVSDYVNTPRASVSPRTDMEDFNVTPTQFMDVLDYSGFASDKFDVALDAASQRANDTSRGATLKRLLEQANAIDVANLNAEDDELREIINLLLAGKTIDEIRSMLASRLSLWLAERGDVDSLQTLLSLRLALTSHHSKIHHAGGSLLSTTSDFNLRWLPSMNEREV